MAVITNKTLSCVILLDSILFLTLQSHAQDDIAGVKAKIESIRSGPELLKAAIDQGRES